MVAVAEAESRLAAAIKSAQEAEAKAAEAAAIASAHEGVAASQAEAAARAAELPAVEEGWLAGGRTIASRAGDTATVAAAEAGQAVMAWLTGLWMALRDWWAACGRMGVHALQRAQEWLLGIAAWLAGLFKAGAQ